MVFSSCSPEVPTLEQPLRYIHSSNSGFCRRYFLPTVKTLSLGSVLGDYGLSPSTVGWLRSWFECRDKRLQGGAGMKQEYFVEASDSKGKVKESRTLTNRWPFQDNRYSKIVFMPPALPRCSLHHGKPAAKGLAPVTILHYQLTSLRPARTWRAPHIPGTG